MAKRKAAPNQKGKDKLKIITVQPVEEKKMFDIGIPDITPVLGRKKSLAEEIGAIFIPKAQIINHINRNIMPCLLQSSSHNTNTQLDSQQQ